VTFSPVEEKYFNLLSMKKIHPPLMQPKIFKKTCEKEHERFQTPEISG
jgi:hypothetical protein